MSAPDFESILGRHLAAVTDARAHAAARHVARVGAGQVAAVIFFGSRRSGAPHDEHSAYDFFVVTRDDRAFYRALHAAGAVRRRPGLLAAAGRVLPPSQVSLRVPEEGVPGGLHVKASVLGLAAFTRETSARRRDHFCVARLFQPASLLFAADAEAGERVRAGIVAAHRLTFEWARPWLPAEFDATLYGKTVLDVSMRSEIRPEPEGRALALWQAQRAYLDEVYGALLEELCRAGRLERASATAFRLAEPVSGGERRAVRRYFRRSLRRATARWLKHMLTFEGWSGYIVRKIERHLPEPLTPRERRHPFVFLWPRMLRHLRDRGRPRE